MAIRSRQQVALGLCLLAIGGGLMWLGAQPGDIPDVVRAALSP